MDEKTIDPQTAYEDIYNNIYGNYLQKHIEENNQWDIDTFHNINWVPVEKIIIKIPLENRATRIKAIHGWLATNSWKNKIHYDNSSTCLL